MVRRQQFTSAFEAEAARRDANAKALPAAAAPKQLTAEPQKSAPDVVPNPPVQEPTENDGDDTDPDLEEILKHYGGLT